MDPSLRRPFNQVWSPALFDEYRRHLANALGDFPFRLAETPLFISAKLSSHLTASANEIIAQLSEPSAIGRMMSAIPERYRAPGMSSLPDFVQIDFGLVRTADGEIEGRVVELQAFPSLHAMETFQADAWNRVLSVIPGLEGSYTCFFTEPRAEAIERMRRCIVADCDPEEVALVDFRPLEQKTRPDFVATKLLFGVDSVCITDIEKENRRLYRRRHGRRIRIRRIYNRLVFDELEAKSVSMPFKWADDLDVSWCSHPNWYWVWSKYSLPLLDHPTVPKTRYLSAIDELPKDLENYVLKPLFSFAGSGVILDVTAEVIGRIPIERRRDYILQRKVIYERVIQLPTGTMHEPPDASGGVKAEVRVIAMRAGEGEPLRPLLPLVRLSRGAMLGVDHNRARETAWTGSTVGIWRTET